MKSRTQWLLLLFFMVVLCFVTGFDAYREYQSIKAAEVEQLTRQTEILDRNLSWTLQKTHEALMILAHEAKALTGSSAKRRPDLRLRRFVSSMVSVRTIVVLDAHATVLDSDKPELIGLNFSSSERYKTIRDGNDPALLYVFPPDVTPLRKFAMSVGVVIADGRGGFGGYVLAILDPEYFSTLLSSLVYAPDVRLGLVHQNGVVVYRVPDAEHIVGQNILNVAGAVFPGHLAQNKKQTFHESRTAAFSDIRYTSFRKVFPETSAVDNPLHVYISRDRKTTFSGWYMQLYHSAGLIIIIMLVASTGLIAYQKRQSRLLQSERRREAERANAEEKLRRLNEGLEDKVRDRTEALSKANAELGYLSHHDVLTGLHNRLSAAEHLRSEFMRMKRSGSVYAVLMMDIDFFKNVNDTYGHATGDRVLRNVADAIKFSVRESDFVARYGGEEFLVLLPDADVAGATLAAEKIRTAVESNDCPGACRVTVSVGMALSTSEDRDEEVAVQLADARLYIAKSSGRNRVVTEGVSSKAGSA